MCAPDGRQVMAYIHCQNYMLLHNILLCDIDTAFFNMYGLFGYLKVPLCNIHIVAYYCT